jgi:hypothetical protein
MTGVKSRQYTNTKMIGKKINQLPTELAPVTTDLTIIGDPVTGVSKKITLSQIANLFATSGTVTSVAVTETGDALTITGSPITTSGTINIAFAGTSSQYVNGAGNLITFPTSLISGSGASGQVTFFNGTNSVTGTNNFFWDAANNRLGIGTTTPQRSLEIFNSTADNHLRLSGSAPSVSMGEAVTGAIYQAKFALITANGQFVTAGVAGDFLILSQTGATIFATNSTEKMRVSASGNLSVGNTNNTYRLDVTGTARLTGQLRLESTITDGTNTYTLPSATGTLALTSQIPSLTGYVPYTGATANVDLGSFDLTTDIINLNQLKAVGSGGLNIYSNSGTHIALMGGGGGAGTTFYGGIIGVSASFTSSGSSDTFGITHSSGSGIALNITKGGNGEGLYINKTSGSGNAATIIGTLNATTLVKSGGTSAQFLKADGSVDSSTYLTTSAASSTYLPLAGGTLTGALGGTSASFSTTLGVTGLTTATGGILTNSIKSANTAANLVIGTDSALGTSLVFTTDFSERMRINASGNVSINNTNDTYKLDVTGTGRFSGLLTISGVSNNNFQSNRVGTNAHFQTWYESNGTTRRGYFGYGEGGSNNFFLLNEQSGTLNIGTNGTTNLTIASTGAATFSSSGIANGTTKFTVAGAGLISSFGTAGSGTDNYIRFVGNTNSFDVGINGTSWGVADAGIAYRLIVTQAGLVGIGTTSPNKKLEVVTGNGTTDGIRLTYASGVTTEGMDITYLNTGQTTTSFDSLYNSNSAVMQFRMKTNGAPLTAMTILGSGNVGIGTNTPGSKLSIVGLPTSSAGLSSGDIYVAAGVLMIV